MLGTCTARLGPGEGRNRTYLGLLIREIGSKGEKIIIHINPFHLRPLAPELVRRSSVVS